MGVVVRLLTVVDVDEAASTRRDLSVSARHEAVLADGRRVLLLGDRGWTSSLSASATADIWAMATTRSIEDTARTVVGPDEPPAGQSAADMQVAHANLLAGILRRHGFEIESDELGRLPHDVELSERLLVRIAEPEADSG